MSSETYPARAAFVGRQRAYALEALAVALALALVFSIPGAVGPLPDWYRPDVYVAVLAVSSLGGAAVHAYYNSGLVVSWLVAGIQFTPINLGYTLTSTSVGDPSLAFTMGLFLFVLGLYGTVVGTVGFAIGVGLRESRGARR
ncbi:MULTISPECIES: hypothetical protein [Halorussus]|uniref:hypothetical protein n=1 Tax=Halorussus TaxID=1070314 RepID=UPI000E20E3CC|nr:MULTISPECIES: hypothetical protein [Halorussus]NHN57694.1 hypothetical protein [Halorussus sp. JP-T4]